MIVTCFKKIGRGLTEEKKYYILVYIIFVDKYTHGTGGICKNI